jgi:hypothetical protein
MSPLPPPGANSLATALAKARSRMTTPDPQIKALQAQLQQALQDAEDAEHARDAANLARMKVLGQLNAVHKALATVVPEVKDAADAQSVALQRVEWLATHGRPNPEAAAAARLAELEAPIPGRAVLEAVIAGKRKFTKEQLEFTISEAMVLSGWEMTPLELMEKGEVWLAKQVLKNQGASAE